MEDLEQLLDDYSHKRSSGKRRLVPGTRGSVERELKGAKKKRWRGRVCTEVVGCSSHCRKRCSQGCLNNRLWLLRDRVRSGGRPERVSRGVRGARGGREPRSRSSSSPERGADREKNWFLAHSFRRRRAEAARSGDGRFRHPAHGSQFIHRAGRLARRQVCATCCF